MTFISGSNLNLVDGGQFILKDLSSKYNIGDKVDIIDYDPIDCLDNDNTTPIKRTVTIYDIIYSVKKDTWYYKYSWYVDSIDSGSATQDVESFDKENLR